MRGVIPEKITSDHGWIVTGASKINLALGLMPFAGSPTCGLFGVVRDRWEILRIAFFIGFLWQQPAFLAMVFISMAIAAGFCHLQHDRGETPDYTVIYFGRALMLDISNVYALRMAGVTMISLATIWIRTAIMPRWLVVVTIRWPGSAGGGELQPWITLVFPAWVFLISLFILWVQFKHPMDSISVLINSGNPDRCANGMDRMVRIS